MCFAYFILTHFHKKMNQLAKKKKKLFTYFQKYGKIL